MKKYNYKIINKQNQLRVRENLFEKIESEQDAYWLGFLFADGYISDKGVIELSLKYSDSDHLLKFAEYCKFDLSKVVLKQKVNNYFRCRISFALGQYKKRLNNLGLIPRKSLVLQYPLLNENLDRHFIRGYFDGDGCFNIRKPRSINNINREVHVSILGTESFLKTLNEKTSITQKNIRQRKNIFTLSFHCLEAKKFLNYIYKDSTIYLDRKYEKYQKNIAPLYSNI